MSRRSWLISASSVAAAVLVLISLIIYHERVRSLPLVDQVLGTADLSFPSAPKQGNWGDPTEGARWQEERRRIGIELSRRKENGPVRCVLQVVTGAAARQEPELQVELRNVSDKPVTIRIHRFLLDTVTFILRDPEDNVVSSFCYVTVHSTFEALPPIILGPSEVQTSKLFLSVAADHGFQPLRPGLYSLEAVFHENSFFDPIGPKETMLARSNRIPIRVE